MPLLEILVVDDDQDVRLVIGLSLRLDPDIAIQSVDGGAAAVDLMRSGYHPDAIMTDYRMPDVTGLEMADEIRKLPGCAEIKIIFLTAMSDLDTHERLIRSGAAGVIIKPFDPVTFAAKVRTTLLPASD